MYITISGFEQMSAQQVFDMSARHLLSQKKRAFGLKPDAEGFSCLYDGPSNTTCAAGVFIRPEKRHDADLGSSSWDSLEARDKVPSANRDLIRQLQMIHDNPYEGLNEPALVARWSTDLRGLAKSRNLNEDAIDEMLTGS